MSARVYLLVLVSSVCLLAAADDPYGAPIPILKDDRTQDAYGGYSFDFESGNGIVRQESGKESDGQAKEGGWRYTSPEGVPVEIVFVADQGGFQPQGAVIPVAPPLPYQRSAYKEDFSQGPTPTPEYTEKSDKMDDRQFDLDRNFYDVPKSIGHRFSPAPSVILYAHENKEK
ncbi:cuticle protein CP14.6-like [Penaeus indicus]|uniref:cuticle protein CP14.6-like n=1 Tax=Penaeus indicus TaxID=29960 RepID=UPI00300D1153